MHWRACYISGAYGQALKVVIHLMLSGAATNQNNWQKVIVSTDDQSDPDALLRVWHLTDWLDREQEPQLQKKKLMTGLNPD